MSDDFPQALQTALRAVNEISGGQVACARCGQTPVIAPETIEFLQRLHGDGALARMDPENVRMILFFTAFDAGWGAAVGGPSIICPDCATDDDLARAVDLVANTRIIGHGFPSDN
ncbi:MAG TPA: hypothetical protein VKS25_05255 [Solirubrobacteraceae bacterium]|nr:hypothetical protein [Solirubrobacteraceae bacterium]